MGIRDKLCRLQKATKGELESFELLDGSTYWFNPTSAEIFLHWAACIRSGSVHNWPEPPEVVFKALEAKDIESVVWQLVGEGWNCLVYDPEIMITERRLEPRPLVTSYDPETDKHVPIDPYEDVLEDFSE